MKDRSLIGMWRYAITRKLRKRINKAATRMLALKIDEETADQWENSMCGTSPLNEDCPFFVSTRLPDRNGHCLAPDFAKEWHQAMKDGKQFISPTYEHRNYMVCGCYISIFCELGLSNYNRILRWRKRFARSRTFEMAIQRYFQT